MKTFEVRLRWLTVVLILFLLFPVQSIVVGQGNSTISGTVYDNQTKETVGNVEIQLLPLNNGSVTDPWGNFSFKDLKKARYELRFNHIGYSEVIRNIALKDNQDLVLKIFLDQKVTVLEGVEITDEDPRDGGRTNLPYITNVIESKQIDETSVNDIGDFLRGQPNISGIRKGGTNLDPVVRGFKFSQLNVQVDNGMYIEGGCPNRMDPAIAHIEAEDIRNIEVFKGPYALRYGPSFGGVINLKTKEPVPYDKFHVGADVRLGYASNPMGLKQHLAVRGGNKWIFFNFSGNYNKFNDYKAGNGNFVPSSGLKYNAAGQLGFAISQNHKIILSVNNSFGRNIDFIALPMDLRTDDTKLYSLDYTGTNITNRLKTLTLKAYRSDVNHVMDNKNRPFSDTIVAVTSVNAVVDGVRAEAGLGFDRAKLYAGIDYKNIYKDGKRVKTAIMQPTMPAFNEQIWNNAIINNLGLFAEYHHESSFAEYIATIRLDYNEANSDDIVIEKKNNIIYESSDNNSDFFNLSISLGANKHITEKFSLGLMLGRGMRSPNMTERFITMLPVGFDRYDYLGNPKLKPEINYEIDLTLRYDDNNWGITELNGFYAYSVDFITGQILPPSQQKPLTKDVLGVKKFINGNPVHFTGFEFAYRSPSHYRWGIQMIAAYTRATVSSDTMPVYNDNNEIVDMEVVENDPLYEVPPFESTITFSYKFFGSKFIPKASLRLVASQNYVSKSYYESTSPGFVVADLSFVYQHNKVFSLTGGIKNLFNSNYYEHLNRTIIGSTENLLEPGINFYCNLIITL